MCGKQASANLLVRRIKLIPTMFRFDISITWILKKVPDLSRNYIQ